MKTKTLFASTIALTLIGSAIVLNPEAARADYSTCSNSTRLCLRKGDSGPIVQALANDLRTAGYYAGEDGDQFTAKVEDAVKAFQRYHRHVKNDQYNRYSDLTIDGVVGRDTVLRLCQKVYRGCEADAQCYTGSVQLLLPCYKNYQRILKS